MSNNTFESYSKTAESTFLKPFMTHQMTRYRPLPTAGRASKKMLVRVSICSTSSLIYVGFDTFNATRLTELVYTYAFSSIVMNIWNDVIWHAFLWSKVILLFSILETK